MGKLKYVYVLIHLHVLFRTILVPKCFPCTERIKRWVLRSISPLYQSMGQVFSTLFLYVIYSLSLYLKVVSLLAFSRYKGKWEINITKKGEKWVKAMKEVSSSVTPSCSSFCLVVLFSTRYLLLIKRIIHVMLLSFVFYFLSAVQKKFRA